ncbi:uncharacterized protein LOC131947442 [Physella acuta]|uniref:uncharacterized protein LOC131947442 n=1 Tax=Physella acuta TaxID=109671 RepID=UPI0027DD4993|nr:uncharacterized protein LOC131947442 [Physella acuta]
MTSFLLFLLKVFVSLNCCIQKSKAISSSLGTKFYFVVPNDVETKVESQEVLVYLFTLSTKDVEIDLTSPWFDGEQLNIHQVLRRLQVHSIQIPTTHISTQQIGTQYTYKIVGARKFGVIVFEVAMKTSADSFTLVPVEGWGKKYVAWALKYKNSSLFTTA